MINPVPNFNFLEISSATARCMRLLGKPDTDKDTVELVQEMLIYSAGTKDGVIYYRPWYVAALLLSQDLTANNLLEADGVKFQSKEGIVKSFIATQRSLDLSLGLTLPPGFSIESIIGTNRKRVYGSSSATATFAF